MKKKTSTLACCLLTAICCLLAASCDSKLCYCFERVNGVLQRTEMYVSSDTPCASKSLGNRGCIERSELGTIDPEDIAK